MKKPTQSISHAIARQLEQMILDAELLPGQKIPSERQLSERLGVSRSIVREGLRELQGRGLIVTRHGQGSFVAEMVAPPTEESPLIQLFFGHNRTLYDLYEVREQLEGQAAYLAAERGTEKDFYFLGKAFDALEQADDKQRAEKDHEFHRAIVEASHNAVLVHVLNSLNQLIRHSVQASVINLGHRSELKSQIDKHHRQIYHAITGRQPDWARKAATAHVRHVCRSLRELEAGEQPIIREEIGEKKMSDGKNA